MRVISLVVAFLSGCGPVVAGSKGETATPLDDSPGGQDSHAPDDSREPGESGHTGDTGDPCEPTEEVCNGLDDDCDGEVDEDLLVEVWTDADGDGYGDPADPQWVCEQGQGQVDNDQDCLDSDATAWPGSHELETPGDGVDTDCDGLDACTDLSCDGWPDLVIGGFYDGDYEATTWIYRQDGGVSDGDREGVDGLGVEDVAAADLDGDGYMDLVLANYQDGSTRSIDSYVYWGSSDGYSERDRTDLPTQGALDVLIEDLDDDGYLDLVFANYRDDDAWDVDSYIYWGGASGYDASDRADLPTNGARAVASGDLDGDGDADLVFCGLQDEGSSYSTTSTVYWSDGGTFRAGSRTDLPTVGCRDVGVADLNDDGLPDLVFASFYDGSTYDLDSIVYWNTGSDYSEDYSDTLPTRGAIDLETGDFDDDGHVDVVFAGYSGDSSSEHGETRVFWNSSAGFSSAVYDAFDTQGASAVLARDLDGDGYAELVVARTYADSSYDLESYVYAGSSSGWSDRDRVALSALGAQGIAADDEDGDGLVDLTLAGTTGTSSTQPLTLVFWGGDDGSGATTWEDRDSAELEPSGSRAAPLWVGTAR